MQQKPTSQKLENFKLAVENSADHITFSDKDGDVLYANKAVEDITGFPLNEAIGRKAGSKELWGGLMSPEFYRDLWQTIKEEQKPFVGEFHNKRKDGSTYYSKASIFPIADESGGVDFFVEIHRDITNEKEFEQTKTEFLSLAVHQLQTPLTIVKWSLELLGQYGPLTEQQSKLLGEANKANQRMVSLVTEMLDVTRIELGMYQPTLSSMSIPEALEKVKQEYLALAEQKALTIQEDYEADLPAITSDKVLVLSSIRILMSNATKYTPTSGIIKISARKKDQAIEIVITDTGFGVAHQEKEKIFTKMYRSEKARRDDPQGIGVGLYTVKKYTATIGGDIWCQSPSDIGNSEHPGAAFHLILPIEPKLATDQSQTHPMNLATINEKER